MYQIDDGSVCFSTSNPTCFVIRKLDFAGIVFHSVSTEQSTSKTKNKKKGHGILGAVVGTALIPGVGIVACEIAGGHNSHGVSQTDGSIITTFK